MLRKSYIPVIITLLWLGACRDKDNVPPDPGTTESYEYGLSYTAVALEAYMKVLNIQIPYEELKYDVELFRMNYHTTYKGKVILVSGMIVIPKTEDTLSTISYQHGTIASNSEAPTRLSTSSTQHVLYAALSSLGMVVVVPDYIGFGASAEIMHPYYVEEMTAPPIIDHILASNDILEEKGINIDNKLYLAGYSQGGYATMAAHKFIEIEGIEGYELVASFPAAGGYDIQGMKEYFLSLETYHEPFYLAYVAQAYHVSFDWDDDLSLYFNEPYASAIPGLFDGSLTSNEINAQLTEDISTLIQNDYIQNSATGAEYQKIEDAFIANSPTNWIPEVAMHMYHGDQDITVPYQNSVDVYNEFINKGASEDIVTFTTIEGGNHSTAFLPYAELIGNALITIRNAQ